VILYVDTSALLKRYVDEPDSDTADALLGRAELLLTARHTIVELRRNLARLLAGAQLTRARGAFHEDLDAFGIIDLDAATCDLAATLAEQTGVRTLDALHLGAATRAGGAAITFCTFDVRQATAARALGFTVVGA
jgi:predicted nucleic acid-binding protein